MRRRRRRRRRRKKMTKKSNKRQLKHRQRQVTNSLKVKGKNFGGTT
jgi:hypothetical protein